MNKKTHKQDPGPVTGHWILDELEKRTKFNEYEKKRITNYVKKMRKYQKKNLNKVYDKAVVELKRKGVDYRYGN